MKFSKYMHIECLGSPDVEGILDGIVYVFPKIDGANVQVYKDGDSIVCGSRNKPVGSVDGSNWRGLQPYINNHPEYAKFFEKYPDFRLHGEWLVPHTLKTYRDDAWNTFYVFDVSADLPEGVVHIPYNVYMHMMEEFHLPYIPCMSIVENGITSVFEGMVENNHYLMKPDEIGEGVVIKRYDFVNKYGRTVWAKIVRTEFKREHGKAFGVPVSKEKTIEDLWVDQFVTTALVEKEIANLSVQHSGWNKKLIPALLGTVFHTLVVECTWHALKKFKAYQVIDFRRLQKVTVDKIKELHPDLFA